MKAIVQDVYGPLKCWNCATSTPPCPATTSADPGPGRRRRPGRLALMTGLPYLTRVVGYGLRKPKTRIRGRAVAGLVEAVGPECGRLPAGR